MLDPDDAVAQSHFSPKPSLLRDILRHARPLGHNEDAETLNFGFGFLYYGLVHSLRPQRVLVIGPGFGFSVTCLGLGLKDNCAGQLTFVDPSFSVPRDGPLQTFGRTSQWHEPANVKARFRLDDVVTHQKLTNSDFFERYGLSRLPPIELAFIDGSHVYDHARRDFINLLNRARKDSHVLLHDSNINIREMVRHAGVKRWLKQINKHKELFEIADFPLSSGVALGRVLRKNAWKHLA